jgi:ecotropic viral integration site 5 protein
VNVIFYGPIRSASKDLGLEAEYARLLKESSIHEKAIMRDLGRSAFA